MKRIKIFTATILLLSIIFGLLGINGRFNSVSAVTSSDFHTESAPRPTGSTYTASANYLEVIWDNAYCLQYGDSLTDSSMTFTVADYVELRGNKGYFYDANGNLKNTTSNSRNDILATILYEGAFSGDDSWSYGMHSTYSGAIYNSSGSLANIYSKAQLGLWYYLDTWCGYSNDNGTNPSWSFKAPSNNDMGEEAFDAANSLHESVDYGIDMYHLTSSSYQDILLVYPASSEGGSGSTNTPTDFYVGKEWWYDEGSGMQPSAIEVTLLGNGVEVNEDIDGNTIDNPIILDSSYSMLEYYKSIDTSGYYDEDCSDYWEYTFENLPTKDSSGNTITYTATESVAYSDEQDKFDAYYQSRYYGSNYYIFYNCLYTDISVKKEWDDNNDQDGKRPTSITVQVYANGEEYVNEDATTVVTLNESNNWAGEFQYLPQYINGEKVEYTVKEAEVEGYTSSVSGDASSGFTITNTYVPEVTQLEEVIITNTHTPEKINIDVTKKWEDNNNANNKRPTSITINLMANGTQIETATLSGTENEWTYTFEDLYKYESGTEIVYTIEEDSVEGYTKNITGDQTSGFVITNIQEPARTDIKGLVWNDGAAGKDGEINGVWVENSSDKGLEGIPVELYDKDNNLINATETDSNGQYTITVEDVDLTDAYVIFRYDGMTYTTVKPNVETYEDGDTTINATSSQQSKAVEDEDARDKFDEAHSAVETTTQDPEKWTDKDITASTKDVISLNEEGSTQEEETDIKVIENVNLGLFKREQPNVAIFSDLTQVKVTMNGQEYTYLYGVRSNKYNPEDADYLQVKFQNKDTYTYKRPVNPADIAYLNETDNSDKEMEVLVTYKIKVANLSTTLVTTVNEIVNAYDSQYTIDVIKKGDLGWEDYNTDNEVYSSEGFNQVMLEKLNIVLQPGSESEDITITYKVSADAVKGLLSEEPTLNNAVEICSYSTTYGENTLYAEQRPYEGEENARKDQPYAGYDYDSHPGNAGIKYSETSKRLEASNQEDDTDIAPSFILCKDNPKTLSGTVWEDEDANDADNERLGNGKIDEDENNGAENVKVELYEIDNENNVEKAKLYDASGNEKIAEVVFTASDGSYSLEGVVTGIKYFAKFTYGNAIEDETTKIEENKVNARNYKSTIITDQTVIDIMGESYNENWLLTHTDNYSVAVDNLKERLEIPSLKNGNYDVGVNMSAYTKPFVVQLEFDYTGETNGNSDEEGTVKDKNGTVIENELSKLDFGIIERPREDLVVQKTITNFKITLANRQELTSGNPSDPNADIPYTKTMGFVKFSGVQQARQQAEKQLLIEMDTELIQGAKLELEYQVSVLNNNEIDYDYEADYSDINGIDNFITSMPEANYYYYGNNPNKQKPESQSELSANIQIIDYMSRELIFNNDSSTGWELVDNINQLNTDGFIGDEAKKAINDYGYKVFQTAKNSSDSRTITIENGDEYVSEKMTTYKTLANKDENIYDNSVEIIEIDGKTARTVKGKDENEEQISYTPGNYEPGKNPQHEEVDDDRVNIIITPPTGIVNYIITYAVTILAGLLIIVVGIIFIKRKVLTR